MSEKGQQLEQLFINWKKKQAENHVQEDAIKCDPDKSTFPDLAASKGAATGYWSDFYTSFCYDGFLKPPAAEEKTILFICREANLTSKKIHHKALMPEKTCCFWMSDEFERNYQRWLKTGSGDKYVKFVCTVAKKYGGVEHVGLAYMNLNKRGGFGSCNMTRVGHYTEMYQSQIRQEIEIIDPDIIICGGTYDTVVKYFPEWEGKCRDYWHPSRGVHEKKGQNGIDL